ncbi:MAG: ATP-binding protein, partial [Acidimicrobiales bacterium]|nr:ATP-binding protein [Acidimicrobiales bacterium]
AFAEAELPAARPDVPEAAAMVLAPGLARAATSVDLACEVSGLLSQHRRISERTLAFRYDSLLGRIAAFRRETVPGFRRYQQARHEALERWRADLHLAEYQPQVMSAFVRNRLIDEVYLPLIGDNLAKQLGTVDGGRTDQTGLLLLVSPPGYGKTTLMEYVANRLGLVFVKVNGPALGTGVRSLDPAEAPNATAAQEVAKIGFALEMANNVLLYLDDIQHTHPELLQKFISLCDAQRRIEAVWRGRARGYDLRGKRFAVVMAGNPYTESGERFRVPDMLANRADTYNLGEVLSGHDDLFALSYLENSLTSNPMLAPLAGRDPADVQRFIAIARGEAMSTDELSYPYTAAEQRDIVETFRRLLRVQQVVLTVNRAYIASASQADEYRTEPPFRLQGSYRNMNRLAEKVVAVMSDAEIETLLDDHYRGEAQTLTNGAEANLLKLAELRGRLTPEQRQRWEQIRADHRRVQLMGAEDDPASRVAGAIAGLSDQLHHLGSRLIGDPPVG